MITLSHKELAALVNGKKILHLNSLGKDSVACLAWLEYAGCEVVSCNLKFLADHPDDGKYFSYLKKRFPQFEFIQKQDTQELNKFAYGIYQSPVDCLLEFNSWPHELEMEKYVEEIRLEYGCDYTCWGMSKYESVTRATGFYKKGLMQGTKIFPLGLMDKSQVLDITKTVKQHPVYKLAPSTLDFPSWHKMRNSCVANPKYYEQLLAFFPLLALDRFRYEVLFEKK